MFEAKGPISDRLRKTFKADDPAWTPGRDTKPDVKPETVARADVTPLGNQNRVTEDTM